MKVAVSSTGTTLDSQVDPRFGRTSYFLVVDPDEKKILEVIDNRAAQEAAHGAGINAATSVAQADVDVVLTGRVGPKAYAVLRAAGIKVVSEVEGTVEEVIDQFISGNHTFSDGPDCNAHASSPSPRTGYQGGGGGGAGKGKGKGCKCGGSGKRGNG
ncbi:MAG: dinitrogenase iron-molybdenum cofactor biosynthesis protein [Thermodesulfobacteria bacterium]|nr:dinitrogenase iron-molybdenum cofactor biosynthesis protein [Thermodesulfobacteriota bacterium]